MDCLNKASQQTPAFGEPQQSLMTNQIVVSRQFRDF